MKAHWVRLLLVVAGLAAFGFASDVLGSATGTSPVQLQPTDGMEVTYLSHPPLAIPNFEWTAVEGATQYEVWIARDVTFNDRITIKTGNLRYTPVRSQLGFFLDSTDTFYWRVRVSQPDVSEWSNGGIPWTFSKKWGVPTSDPPNAPQLLSPDDVASLEFYDAPTFSWTPIAGAASYRLEIARDEDFSTMALTQSNLPSTTFQPMAKLSNGTYYWRVMPYDVAGHLGATSEIRQFTMAYGQDPFEPPQQISPTDGSFPIHTPTFEWEAVNGAQFYKLEYSTDATFQSGVSRIDTRSTSYTPNQLPNDVNYYWRVRSISGSSQTDWSDVWSFEVHWYIQPQLLTPVASYQHMPSAPLFSWTPVPGAAYYLIEWARDQHFLVDRVSVQVIHTYYYPYSKSFGSAATWFWRVTPYHGAGYAGAPSTTRSFTFDTSGAELVPDQVYPSYFYEPDAALSVHEPTSATLPIFAWTRAAEGLDFVGAYRLEVDDDPLFGSPNYVQTTANSVVVPDWTTPFTPQVGIPYYWRVRSIDQHGVAHAWSQRWLVEFDPSLGLQPTSDTSPQLLRPVNGAQGIEDIPLLEWWPIAGASAYTVTIATDPAMAHTVVVATAQYPAYAHAQALPYDTYYWQVQASDGAAPVGSASEIRRFQVAAQNRWREAQPEPMVSEAYTKTLVAQDSVGEGTPDLANLYVANDSLNWNIGFDVMTTTTSSEYMILIDVDRTDGMGALSDPVYGMPVITAHRPEYAIYIPQSAYAPETGGFDADQASFYAYESGMWLTPQTLPSIGGSLYYTDALTSAMILDGFLQVQLGLGSLGTPGTVAVEVVVLDDANEIADTLPASREPTLDGFVSVSEEVMLVSPLDGVIGDPTTHAHIPVMRWHPQVDAGIHPSQGYAIEIARDPEFSSIAEQATNFRWPGYTIADDDLDSDNTYYWRARVKHDGVLGDPGGPYNSNPWRFTRQGLVPDAPQVEMVGSSVTFYWDKVEGTDRFFLEWSTDPNFGTYSSVDVRAWQHTPQALLAPATYYWRVRVRQWKGEQNNWAEGEAFTVSLPTPSDLQVQPAGLVVPRTPTLTWSACLTPTDTPRFAAWKYSVQICRDENMTDGCQSVITEQHAWTPPNTFMEGALYWRVRLVDGSNHYGEWTENPPVTSLIMKQYPATTLVSPVGSKPLGETPTFIWEPVNTMAYYHVEISKDELFSKLYDQVDTAATQYTPLKIFDPVQYYWRVCVRDKDGKQGPCSDSIITLDALSEHVFLPLALRN